MTRPTPRIRHSMLCDRTAPILETIRVDATGRAHIVSVCSECDRTDLAHRIELEAAARRHGDGDEAA